MAPGGFERGGALDPELKTDVSGRRWLLGMILVAASYVVIGVVFAALAKPADADHVRMWRLAAWLASAPLAAAHIRYEHYRPGAPPRTTAPHAARGVAPGALRPAPPPHR